MRISTHMQRDIWQPAKEFASCFSSHLNPRLKGVLGYKRQFEYKTENGYASFFFVVDSRICVRIFAYIEDKWIYSTTTDENFFPVFLQHCRRFLSHVTHSLITHIPLCARYKSHACLPPSSIHLWLMCGWCGFASAGNLPHTYVLRCVDLKMSSLRRKTSPGHSDISFCGGISAATGNYARKTHSHLVALSSKHEYASPFEANRKWKKTHTHYVLAELEVCISIVRNPFELL